jgi:hypothetical protein
VYFGTNQADLFAKISIVEVTSSSGKYDIIKDNKIVLAEYSSNTLTSGADY